jgi:hypothetical protein
MSEMQEKINELCDINNIDKQFYPQEIGVSKIFEACRDDYEKNLLVAWQKYESVYHDLHFKCKIMNEKLSTLEEQSVIMTANALEGLKLLHILTDGLDTKTLKYLRTLMK